MQYITRVPIPPEEMGLYNHPPFLRPHNIGPDQAVTPAALPTNID